MALLRFTPSFSSAPLALASCSVIVAAAPLGAASVDAKRSFDLPRGDAATTLRQFAATAGRSLVFVTDKVRGETTNAVRGEFTPRDALDRMLAGSALEAAQDAATGALVVSRKRTLSDAPPRTGEVGPVSDSQPKPPAKPMKSPRTFLAAVAGWLTASIAGAQTAPAPSLAEAKAEEALLLSPFTVASQRDTGYQATSTLAGTRVRTELRDVATSVTVLTKDFLADVGATDARDLFLYLASTEVTGFGGNFSGGRNFAQSDFVSDNPGIRVRGLARADNLRNYFGTEIPFDSYNVERVEVNRGANASLFGLGSPAGVINTSLIEAEFRNRLTLEARGGSYGSLRGSFDLNRVLVPDTVAIRVAGVSDRRRFQQEPAFEDVSRIFGTATAQKKLFRDSTVLGRTRLRANYEEGLNDANRPRTLPPLDQITSWFTPFNFGATKLAPKPTWNGAADVAALRQGRELDLIQGFFRAGTAIYPGPSATVPTDPFGGGVQARQGVVSNVPNPNGAPFTGVFVVPIPMSTALQLANVPGNSYFGSPLLRDTSVFDFRNQLLDGPNKSERTSFSAASFAVEQLLFGDRGGVEYAHDHQRTRGASRGLINQYIIAIDANTVLIDGTPNPHFGRPVTGGSNGVIRRNEASAATHRITAFYDLDFATLTRNRWARWLGRHVVTGLYSSSTSDSFSASGNLNYLGPEFTHGSGSNVTNGDQRTAGSITYLGPSLANASSPAGANLSRITAAQWLPSTLVVRGKAPAAGVPFSNQTVGVFEGAWTTGNRARQEIDSSALVWQSYLLEKLLVGTLSWRQDEFKSFTAGAPPITADGNRIVRDPSWTVRSTPDLAVKDGTFSYGGVLHAPALWLKRVPVFSGLSVRYNESENFSPGGGVRFTMLGQSIAPQSGGTRDYGVSFSALDQKFAFSVTRYETNQSKADSTIGPSVGTLITSFGRAHQEHRRFNRPVGPGGRPVNASGEELPNLPAAYLALYNFTWDPNAGPIGTYTFGSPNIGRLTSFVAKGWEFEGVWNVTKDWRVAFNAARQQSVRSDTMSDQFAFITQPLLKRTNGQAISLLDAWTGPWAGLQTNEVGNETLGTQTALFRDQLAAARAQDGGPAQELRKWRFNVVTNYDFNRGRLKGFSVGGACRWQDAAAIGFPLVAGPGGALITDVTRPIFGPTETHFDAWIGYKRRLWRDRVEWRVQLNVRNVFNNDDLVPIGANPDGAISAWQIPLERSWEVSSTFRF